MYLKVGIQKVSKGSRYPKGTYSSKVSKRHLKANIIVDINTNIMLYLHVI